MNRNQFSSHFAVWPFGTALLLLCLVGCGGSSGPKLVQVKGKVTVGGSAPFANGIVRFTPQSVGKLAGGAAATDKDGQFTLKFQGAQKNGIEPGDYNVSFSLWKMPDGSPLPEEQTGGESKSPAELGGVNFVPAEYANLNSSKYSITISKKGDLFDFDIPELKPQQVKRQAHR